MFQLAKQQRELYVEFTGEDVRRTLFAIDDNKTHGPDGHTSYFSKEAWSYVGADITEAIMNFFRLVCCLSKLMQLLFA